MHARRRLVTFRLSEEEYEHLCNVSAARGARSVSDFVRSGVGWIIENCDRRVWEILSSQGQGVFSPASSPLRLDQAHGGREKVADNREAEPEHRDASADTLLALETLSDKVATLFKLLEDRLTEGRKIN
jgi:hypothetical protein